MSTSAVRTLIDGAFERASTILKQQREALERGAGQLLAKETLDEADLKALLTPSDQPKALLRIAAASKEHPPAVAG